MTALLGDAEADAGIAAWGVKYDESLWRPIHAINICPFSGGGTDWSFPGCTSGWLSLIATPPHPDYVAGHPTFSQAASVVLADFFDSDRVAFASTSQAYCNAGTPGFDGNGLVITCTQGARTWSVGNHPEQSGRYS